MHRPSIYLDYAAATPLDTAAWLAMQPYLGEQFYNPSAVYQAARIVRQSLEAARQKVARVLGSKDQEIFFTAGGTEANNLAIHGVLMAYPDSHAVVSVIEHDSVLNPARRYSHTVVPVSQKGLIDPKAVAGAITEETALISVMYANNEIGSIQPIKDLAALVTNIRAERLLKGNNRPLYLHSDACQAANYLDLQVSRLGVDLLTLNGGKIYAGKQTGCLYVRSGVHLQPQIFGGGQESGRRSGTENIPGIIAFATMLQNVQSDRKPETARLVKLRNQLYATLSQKYPEISHNGSVTHGLPNLLNITVPGVDGERLLMELDEAGLMVATGSACSASSEQPSHVLRALGLSNAEASASLRFSLGRPTTPDEIDAATKILVKTIQGHQRLV